ncbi:MAG: fumarylacetoacetate hydrolase family protein [Pseudomonadales bacterium]|nr:fumarylacetoacetate hydrolase family protein [Pseudomonadales bacterium]
MFSYRLLSYTRNNDQPRTGLLIAEKVYDLDEIAVTLNQPSLQTDSVLSLIQSWQTSAPILEDIATQTRNNDFDHFKLSEIKLETPLPNPGTLYCAGANYLDHLEEMTGRKPVKEDLDPFFFLKPPASAIVATEATVKIPSYTKQLDWEAEIAMIIGKQGRDINIEDASDYIAGLTILNDLSARDKMKRYDVPFLFDWIGQKCFDGSAPTGPWITPFSAVENANNLAIKLWVNDTLHQNSNSNQMIFNLQEQIAYLSRHVTLFPGDIIATGTPAGVGHARGIYLKSGDVVRIAISELGELVTYISD